MLDSRKGTLAQQTVLTLDSMHAFVDIAKWKNPDRVLVQKILLKKCLSELIKLVKL
jgi:hypothetical protein